MKTFSSDKDSEFSDFTIHQLLFMHYSPEHYSCYCSCVNFVRILYLCSLCLLNESIKRTPPFICKQNFRLRTFQELLEDFQEHLRAFLRKILSHFLFLCNSRIPFLISHFHFLLFPSTFVSLRFQ
jgi:hypothetical protein